MPNIRKNPLPPPTTPLDLIKRLESLPPSGKLVLSQKRSIPGLPNITEIIFMKSAHGGFTYIHYTVVNGKTKYYGSGLIDKLSGMEIVANGREGGAVKTQMHFKPADILAEYSLNENIENENLRYSVA